MITVVTFDRFGLIRDYLYERDENGEYFFGIPKGNKPGEVEGELSFGYVILNPKARGKGYGKQMLQLGIKFAFELYGASKVTLEVFENNPSAYHCYKAVGFVENGYSLTYNICNEEWKSIAMEICK